jgi:hypothetical protein
VVRAGLADPGDQADLGQAVALEALAGLVVLPEADQADPAEQAGQEVVPEVREAVSGLLHRRLLRSKSALCALGSTKARSNTTRIVARNTQRSRTLKGPAVLFSIECAGSIRLQNIMHYAPQFEP